MIILYIIITCSEPRHYFSIQYFSEYNSSTHLTFCKGVKIKAKEGLLEFAGCLIYNDCKIILTNHYTLSDLLLGSSSIISLS